MNVFGIDIGGSGIKGAPVDTQSGELLEERVRIKTPKPATPEAIVGTAVEVVREAGWQGPVGCGFPAVVKGGSRADGGEHRQGGDRLRPERGASERDRLPSERRQRR